MNKKSKSGVLRKTGWLAGFALLVSVAMGLYVYSIGKRTMLEHAESLTLRRMTVSQAEDGAFRFFYATNRQAGTQPYDIKNRYLPSRESTLKFGSFDTRIEPSLGLGIIIDPSKWLLNEEIKLLDVQSLQREQFLGQLRQQVEASPERSLLIVVHGFREAYPSALRKTAFLAHVLDINTPILLFDWPGDQGGSLRGYRRARSVATESGQELAAMLRLVIDEVQPQRLWLMANSMGGQVVVKAFSELYREARYADSQTEIENVILTAADVDHAEFNEQFKQEIKSLSDNTTVYVSSNDRALFASRLINRGRRLGESTVNPGNPDLFEQGAAFSDLLEQASNQLVLVDVTPVNRTRNFHNFSLETPEFFDDLFLRITGKELPQTRELYQVRTEKGVPYYVLTRGR
jgi:esterase/lipase superfamily enzyme